MEDENTLQAYMHTLQDHIKRHAHTKFDFKRTRGGMATIAKKERPHTYL